MKRLSKDDIGAALARQRALPLFNCGDMATGMQVLEALHAGGIRFVEFTNRAAGAIDVFRSLVAEATTKLPDMVLGAGTIIDVAQARDSHAAGAAFLVAPNLDEANLKAWFAAGVHCVGMGSHLVDAKTLAEGRFTELADRARRLTAILASV
jgi:2-keto-3-deoxy-6-phosphogluconate aldolase